MDGRGGSPMILVKQREYTSKPVTVQSQLPNKSDIQNNKKIEA